MRVVADRNRCIGSGQCVLTDPSVFDQDDDAGTVLVLTPEVDDPETIARVEEAVRICPSQALSLVESD